MAPEETFRSKEAYRRWTAYRHMHGIPAPNLKRVCIKGQGCHEVKHSAKRKGRSKSGGKNGKKK